MAQTNDAIATVDSALEAVGLPTYTDLLEALRKVKKQADGPAFKTARDAVDAVEKNLS
jgi:hypothetical protein